MTSNSYTFSNLISAHKDKGLANLKEPFAEIISVGLKHFSKHKNTIVVNVPSTTFAIQKRGLDPISLMTERACEMAGRRFIYENNLLLNRSKRQDQAGLNFRQRKENMHDGFNVGFYTSKPVIIVDDLITTGASLDQSIYSLTKQRIKVKACVVIAANILVKP